MMRRGLILLLIALRLVCVVSSLFGADSSLRGSKPNEEEKSTFQRFLQGFSLPDQNHVGQVTLTRVNPGILEAEPVPEPEPIPENLVPATMPPTPMPTAPRPQHPEMGGTHDGTTTATPFPIMVADLLRENVDQLEPLFGANGTYRVEDFIDALQTSYYWETGPSTKKTMGPIDRRLVDGTPRSMDLSGELTTKQGDFKIAMAHIALLLGTAWHGGLKHGSCDEPNYNATDKENPGCGQHGLNYRYPFDGFLEEGFGCFKNDQEWLQGTATGCPVQPNVDLIVSDAKEHPMVCGMKANIPSRDCCWWGRGMLQMTHQCDYGDFQAYWAREWNGEGTTQIDTPEDQRINICGNPGLVCNDDFPQLRFLTGLYLWVRDVVHAEDSNFDFMRELQDWVANKMDMRQDGNFVDRVGGVLVYGDADMLPPDYRERRHTVEFALDTLMSLPPPLHVRGNDWTYGNVAMCKPATQSSIVLDQVAGNAVDGIVNSPNISHTECEDNPWWQVDLETPHEIYTIAIVNRQDCCFERLDHVKIELLDEFGNAAVYADKRMNSTIQHDPNMEGHIVNVWTVDFETPQVATKVRVSVQAAPTKCDYLNIAEVQVFGYCQFGDACLTGRACHLENVAQCKPTTMSSTKDGTPSSITVDGEAANEAPLMTGDGIRFVETNCEDHPTWEVDLMALHNISMVAVFAPNPLNVGVGSLFVDLINGETGETVATKQFGGLGTIDVVEFEWTEEVQHHLASIVRLRQEHPNDPQNCNALKLAEVQVWGDCWDGAVCVTWPSCSYENIAECKAATQSSTSEGGVAWKAIDGHQALSHTKCEEEPWWEVDLLATYDIDEVILFNRRDCCYDRLNGVVIELKDVEGNTVQSVQHEPDKEGVIEHTWSVKFENAQARKVRVMVQHEPDACGVLNIQDIMVLRTCLPGEECHSWPGCETGNVAQCKPTTQSSTFYGDVSAQAVDGHESLAHTDCELNPWWGVNLLEPRVVTHVIIHNREDCCFERLNNIKVQLYDGAEEMVLLGQMQHNVEVEGFIHTMWIATFDPPVENVQNVFLSTEHPEGFCEFLNLAEVEVISDCLEGDSCMTGFGCEEGNVAKCKPARQSSTMVKREENGLIFAGVAGRAVDGHESLAHTECENNPWWEVDLLSTREINEVIIHNRQDCCFERLNGLLVELKDDADNVVASGQHDPNRDGPIEFSWVQKFDRVPASRVRVSNVFEGECDILNLADVEVISTCLDGDACKTREQCIYGDVAQCKPSRQISTMEGSIARNAVNGRAFLAHTKCEENPWWEVDLLDEYVVTEVIIFNREDCCQERLHGVRVELLDRNGTVHSTAQHHGNDRSIHEKWIATFDQKDFLLTSKVRVSLSHPAGSCGFLSMADVQVMSVCKEGDACLTGSECPGGNVAQCKKAEQSSTFNGAAAIKATDGTESLSMTECEEEPWWMVDLERRRRVTEVVLHNRHDCCFEELNGVKVELMDSFGNVLRDVQHNVTTDGLIVDVWSNKFNEENVRFVKVYHPRNDTCIDDLVNYTQHKCSSLHLAEVEVISVCEEFDACYHNWDCEHVALDDLPHPDDVQ